MSEANPVAIGATGHRNLTDATAVLIGGALRNWLCAFDSIIGVTSLAAGADQLFARAVLAAGGRLHAVIPASGYESTFEIDDSASFRELLALSAERLQLPFERPSEQAYWAAGREVVRRSDRLLAIWDGQPAGGLGGTADVVGYARQLGRTVDVIWPAGASRS
jgi:hypothetical protein